MGPQKKPYHIHLGPRNIKTAISCVLCAALYLIIGRNPTFACIGAVFGTGADMPDSKLNGGNRFFGTIIGGVLGMLLFRLYIVFYPDGQTRPIILLFVCIGVFLLVILCNVCRWPGGVQPGGVVLSILLFNTPVDTFVSYSVNRIIDTGIGVAIALFISWLIPREKLVNWLVAAHLRKPETPEVNEKSEA